MLSQKRVSIISVQMLGAWKAYQRARGLTLFRVVSLLSTLLLGNPAWAQDTSMVPVVIDGQNVRLAIRIYKPPTEGKLPTLVFNHGSTGTGRDPNLFAKPQQFSQLAQFFVQHGWAVVMPSRRGRGGSEGEYDEGFAIDRSRGYTCDPSLDSRSGSCVARHRSRDKSDLHNAFYR
jgi:poly(3-hydroxybutyrate) depolymerase